MSTLVIARQDKRDSGRDGAAGTTAATATVSPAAATRDVEGVDRSSFPSNAPVTDTTALAPLQLSAGARAGGAATKAEVAREAVKMDLVRPSAVEGADGFLASFFKMVGGRESPSSGHKVVGPQLGTEVDRRHADYKDHIKVDPSSKGGGTSVTFSPKFLEQIGEAQVHLIVETEKGLKRIESGVRGKEGSFSFSKTAGDYPDGTIILIEPNKTWGTWASDRVGINPNMHMPLVLPKSSATS